MASFKKELKAIMSRFDAAQEAFTEGTAQAEKSQKKYKSTKKKLKSAKAKISSLEQRVASLEQELKVAKKKAATAPEINSLASDFKSKRKSGKGKKNKDTSAKSTGARRGRPRKTATTDDITPSNLAAAVSDAPDTVSEAAAEKTAKPKARRGRPAANRSTGTGRRGRPATKAPASPLTQIAGVGVTMAARFEESGVTTVEQFAGLSDDDMKEVLQKCGPRYRSADHDRMEGYRQAAREAVATPEEA